MCDTSLCVRHSLLGVPRSRGLNPPGGGTSNELRPQLQGVPGIPTQLYEWLLLWIARDLLPERPNRLEPRVLQRRRKPHTLLTYPREERRKARSK